MCHIPAMLTNYYKLVDKFVDLYPENFTLRICRDKVLVIMN